MRFFYLVFLVSIIGFSCNHRPTKVACIGDSITEGYGLKNQSKTSYPVILDSLLGPGYNVANFGRSATTLQKNGDFPYWITKEFHNLFSFDPDIVIVKLGTNDTKPHNWNKAMFERDYQELVDTLRTIKNRPVIYLCKPVPVFEDVWGINDSTLNPGVLTVVENIAIENNIEIIDLYEKLQRNGEMFPDGIHPDEQGMFLIASIVKEAIE